MKLKWRTAVGVTALSGIMGITIWIVHIENERSFLKCQHLAADQGDVVAKMNLVNFYDEIKYVPYTYKVAVDAAKGNWSRQAAELGYAEAQTYVGSVCLNQGDAAGAVEWFRLAAEQGYRQAQCHLGNCYYLGRGVPQDDEEASRWYRLAADQGYALAQYNLGRSYARGEGVQQDYETAAQWYYKAAERGFVEAQYSLGIAYAEGRGAPRDCVQAYVWLSKAAKNGSNPAEKDLASLVGKMSPEQIAEGKRLLEGPPKKADPLLDVIILIAVFVVIKVWISRKNCSSEAPLGFDEPGSSKTRSIINWYFRVLKNYARFSGRARRKEFWTFTLVSSLIILALFKFDSSVDPVAFFLFSLVICVPFLAVCFRRIHDTGHGSWWFLVGLIPYIGPVFVLMFLLWDSQKEANQYGVCPKELYINVARQDASGDRPLNGDADFQSRV